jgi:hypothetical protein
MPPSKKGQVDLFTYLAYNIKNIQKPEGGSCINALSY